MRRLHVARRVEENIHVSIFHDINGVMGVMRPLVDNTSGLNSTRADAPDNRTVQKLIDPALRSMI